MEAKYLFVIGLLLLMLFVWWWFFFRKKKRQYKEFPSDWRHILEDKVRFYQLLSAADKDRFEKDILDFLEDVRVTGVDVTADDTDKLLVASSAVIPLFGFPGWRYRNLNEVLLYGTNFNEQYKTEGEKRNILGMVGSGAMHRMMLLSKPALHQGFENQHTKFNVGIHEFVHLIDKADGSTDGIPEMLVQHQFTIPWVKMIHGEIRKLKSRPSDINPYGATNEAEFLSVVSEYFFTQPRLLKKHHPKLYALLEEIFRQDLA